MLMAELRSDCWIKPPSSIEKRKLTGNEFRQKTELNQLQQALLEMTWQRFRMKGERPVRRER